MSARSMIPSFIAEDIALRDDAFHRSMDRFRAEWWYFDAVFDNGYSMNANLAVFSKGNYGIVVPVLNIYKESKPQFRRRELRCFNEFSAAESTPLLKFSKKDVIRGNIDKHTGNWVFDVALEVGGQKIDLHFIGTMKGWKGRTPGSQWGVILPRATVQGTITLHGETLTVKGMGYHDHNWEFNLPVRQKGWYWGRFGGDSLNLVWSQIMLTKTEDYVLAVLNEGNSNYVNIEPEKIQFLATKYTSYHGKKIPKNFALHVHDEEQSLDVHVTMEAIDVLRQVRTPLLNYWRYHAQTTGYISYGNRHEDIDTVQILELTKFL